MAGQSRPWAIGIDVGGTKIAAAAVDTASGAVAHRQEIATRQERGAMAVLEDLVSLTQRVAEAARGDGLAVAGVGIGLPELVDDAGRVGSAYLLDWAALPLPARLAETGEVTFASDVRVAALAEAAFGAARPYRLVAYVSVGTGISSTLVVDGEPLAGARGGALVLSSAPVSVPCAACGEWTSFVLEEFASGQGIVRRYQEASGQRVAGADAVLAAAARGDEVAAEIVDSAARALGSAVGGLVNVLDPEAVVIGGGLGLAGGRFWQGVVAATRAHIWNAAARDLPIVPAALGGDAGVIGAALAASNLPLNLKASCQVKGGIAV